MLLKLVKQGKLVPAFVHPDNGARFYNEDDVAAFAAIYPRAHFGKKKVKAESLKAKRWEGLLAGQVFALFKRGAPLHEIVTTLKITPAHVRELWVEYQTSLRDGLEKRENLEQEMRWLRMQKEQSQADARDEFARLRRQELALKEKELRLRLRQENGGTSLWSDAGASEGGGTARGKASGE